MSHIKLTAVIVGHFTSQLPRKMSSEYWYLSIVNWCDYSSTIGYVDRDAGRNLFFLFPSFLPSLSRAVKVVIARMLLLMCLTRYEDTIRLSAESRTLHRWDSLIDAIYIAWVLRVVYQFCWSIRLPSRMLWANHSRSLQVRVRCKCWAFIIIRRLGVVFILRLAAASVSQRTVLQTTS